MQKYDNGRLNHLSVLYEYSWYLLKEFFYDIYDATTREDAIQRFRDWQVTISDDVAFAFNPLVKMVNNWFNEIFNYWDSDKLITNAYTESLNNIIRFTNRKGRGYSWVCGFTCGFFIHQTTPFICFHADLVVV